MASLCRDGRLMPTPNKYTPHTGKKQIAKNKARREKAEAKALISKEHK